jgi:hypothetical protein
MSATTTFANEVESILKTYRNNTFSLNNFNEIYATNKYLDRATSEERDRLLKSLNQLKSSILQMRQEYLIKNYALKEYNVRMYILQWTIIAMCVLFLLFGLVIQGKVGQKLMFIVVASVIFIYALIVFFTVKSNAYRDDMNWNMYYWGPVKKTY